MRKPPSKFQKEEYDKENDWAIQIVSSFLIALGYSIIDKGEDYNVDIHAHKNNKHLLIEAEVKKLYPWEDRNSFKFDTVSFLGRKKKWAKGEGFWYFIVCRENKNLLFAHSSQIFKEENNEKIYVNSTRRLGVDTFYRLNKNEVWFAKNIKDYDYQIVDRPDQSPLSI